MIDIRIDRADFNRFTVAGSPETVMCELATIVANIYGNIIRNAVNDEDLSRNIAKPKIIGLMREDFIKHMTIGMAVIEKDVIEETIIKDSLRDADNTPNSKDTMIIEEFLKSLNPKSDEPYTPKVKTRKTIQEENPNAIVYSLKEFIDLFTDGNFDLSSGSGTIHDGEVDTGVDIIGEHGFVKPLKSLGCKYVLWRKGVKA